MAQPSQHPVPDVAVDVVVTGPPLRPWEQRRGPIAGPVAAPQAADLHPDARRRRRRARAGAVVALAWALAACGSSSSTSGSAAASHASTSTATGTTVASAPSARYGTILVTATGRTLYMLTGDSPAASICTGACVTAWPPLTTTGAPRAGSGVNAQLLGTITRADGTRQVTYAGHPLYTFFRDSAAGQVNGEGIDNFGGIWYVLDTAGTPVTSAVPSTSTSATTTTSAYGTY